MHILAVDDDEPIRELLASYLAGEGYRVTTAQDTASARQALDGDPVDLVVCDLRLPDGDGLGLVRQIRTESQIPVIILSSKDQDVDRIVGLELGADDYLPKPFGTRELVARVRAVLRRGAGEREAAERPKGEIQFDGWTVNLPRRELLSPTGAVVDLTGAEFDLLVTLCDHAGRVISRERLIELSRTRLGDSSDRSIDVLVSRLRRKLSDAGHQAPIVTVRGIGYTLNVPVTRA